jgi:hypothetical protein
MTRAKIELSFGFWVGPEILGPKCLGVHQKIIILEFAILTYNKQTHLQ